MKKLLLFSLALLNTMHLIAMEEPGPQPAAICQEKLQMIDNVILDGEIEKLVDEGNLQKIALFLNNLPTEKRYPEYDYVETNYDKHALIHTLAIAAMKGKEDIVLLVINNYPFAKCPIPLDQLLRVGAYNNNFDFVKIAIGSGANPSGIPEYIHSLALPPVINAAKRGHTAILKYLIEHGADMNWLEIPYRHKPFEYTTNALLYALQDNQMESVQAILETIPLQEQIRFKNECKNLCTLQRARPLLVKYVRRIVTQDFIALLAQDHVNYAQTLLNESLHHLAHENFRIVNKAELIAQIKNLQKRVNEPAFKQKMENEIRRLLFAPKPAQNAEPEQMDTSE